MATSTNEDQLNLRIDELVRKVEDALRAALGTIDIGENQALGLLSTIDNLASAPIGDQAALLNAIGLGVLSGAINSANLAAFRAAIGLGNLVTLNMSESGDRFYKGVYVRGDGVTQVGRYIDFFYTEDSTTPTFDIRLDAHPSGSLILKPYGEPELEVTAGVKRICAVKLSNISVGNTAASYLTRSTSYGTVYVTTHRVTFPTGRFSGTPFVSVVQSAGNNDGHTSLQRIYTTVVTATYADVVVVDTAASGGVYIDVIAVGS